MKKIQWPLLLLSIGISEGAGLLSAIVTGGQMDQYGQMPRPALAPPGWVFLIVWTILYLMMGVAAYLVATEGVRGPERRRALLLYGAQLVVNVLWPLLFFRFEAYWVAFFWLLLLWYLVLMTTAAFDRISPLASKLMIPYLLWITFAGYLNLSIAIMA